MESSSDEESEIQNINLLNTVLASDTKNSVKSSSLSTFSTATNNTGAADQSKIEFSIALNKLIDERLKRLENVLIGRLKECRDKLNSVQNLAESVERKSEKDYFYSICGKPYFKYKSYTPPDNSDTVVMKKSGMYDMGTAAITGWTVKDKREFIQAIRNICKDSKKREIHALSLSLKRQEDNDSFIKNKIESLKNQLNSFDKLSLAELALPIEEEYDWHNIAFTLNQRHNANEYQALWKLFLHPSINKNKWTVTESNRLQKIVEKYNFQNWEKIAVELNTQRSGYQCFVYYRTNINQVSLKKGWTTEECEFMIRLVEYYKQDNYVPWSKIAAKIPNRTKLQVYNKYQRLHEKKGRFAAAEDTVILTCVAKFGENFRKICPYLKGRSVSQIRTRYNNLVASNRMSAVWTLEEDKKLLQLMANQDHNNYADIANNFTNKTREHIRTRYQTLVKWMKRYPKKDISAAPRRGARRLGHGTETSDLTKAVTELDKATKVRRKKSKYLSMKSSHEAIDDAITAVILNEMAPETDEPDVVIDSCDNQLQIVVPSNDLNSTNVLKLLLLLNASLNKDKFEKSHALVDQYPALFNKEREVSFVKVGSYSRKDKLRVVHLNSNNVWGHNKLQPWKYVLPPNLNTILGCKQLMSYVRPENMDKTYQVKISGLIRSNEMFQHQYSLLLSRFKQLFVWPMILSNKSPPSNFNQYIESSPKRRKTYARPSKFSIPELTIPNTSIQIRKMSGKTDFDSMVIASDIKNLKSLTS